jgi:hypothetical protein
MTGRPMGNKAATLGTMPFRKGLVQFLTLGAEYQLF